MMDQESSPSHEVPSPTAATLRLIEELTINAASVQQRLLTDILAQNSHCEYLRKLILGSDPRSPAALPQLILSDTPPPTIDPLRFIKLAPLCCYEDIKPFIDRIAAGDTSPILTAHPVNVLLFSSGTSSGKRKLLPAIQCDVATSTKRLLTRQAALLSRHIKDLHDGRVMLFYFMKPDEWTAAGVLMQSRSAFIFNMPEVRLWLEKAHTSPTKVVLGCIDVAQNTYLQLLCGLIRRNEVVRVGALFAGQLIHVLHILQQSWHELVQDIRRGFLSKDMVLDHSVRKAVEEVMKGPNPTLAMQVEEECTREPSWKHIVPRLWPYAKCVSCGTSSSMEQYVSELEFFTGKLPIVSLSYNSSEANFGVNMNPVCSPYDVSYTMLPDMAYFEFLPLDAQEQDQSSLVSLVNVELGREYEIVVTTFGGLYRFQVGDILKVTGFYNSTPQFRLVGRKNVLLSVDVDKTDQATLERAVQAACMGHLEPARGVLVDYTCYTDPSTFPGHYVLFWEVTTSWDCAEVGESLRSMDRSPSLISGEMPSALHVLEDCCMAMEDCFDNVYKGLRKQGRIGPLEIRVVKEGTFWEFMEFSARRIGSVSQFKTPRVIKLAPMIEFFNTRVSFCVKART